MGLLRMCPADQAVGSLPALTHTCHGETTSTPRHGGCGRGGPLGSWCTARRLCLPCQPTPLGPLPSSLPSTRQNCRRHQQPFAAVAVVIAMARFHMQGRHHPCWGFCIHAGMLWDPSARQPGVPAACSTSPAWQNERWPARKATQHAQSTCEFISASGSRCRRPGCPPT